MDHDIMDPGALRALHQTPFVVSAQLAGLMSDVLHQSNPDGWSIENVVTRLHNVERVALTVRIRRTIDEETPFIASIDPPARLR